MQITTLGIDISKNVFQLHGVDSQGKVRLTQRVSRAKLLTFMGQLPSCRVGLEACGGAHYWARELAQLGHEVKMMAPQHVKPYVHGNKTDRRDAQAICEAASRPYVRAVPVSTLLQQDIQTLHRVRQQCIKSRTALVNQLRGLLAEYGIVIPTGIHQVRKRVGRLLADPGSGLSELCRDVLQDVYQRVGELDAKVTAYNARIVRLCQQIEPCQRLSQVPGVGPLTATAFYATVGNAQAFDNGRHVSAWLGLVPKQHASGDRTVLLGIHKRGDRYLRTLLIHGARSVVYRATDKCGARSQWIQRLQARRNTNVAVVALANKNARVLWALLAKGTTYHAA
jgi:transposase